MSKRAEIRRSLREENLYFKEYVNFLEAALDAMSTVIKSCKLCKSCDSKIEKVFDNFGIRMEEEEDNFTPKLLS